LKGKVTAARSQCDQELLTSVKTSIVSFQSFKLRSSIVTSDLNSYLMSWFDGNVRDWALEALNLASFDCGYNEGLVKM